LLLLLLVHQHGDELRRLLKLLRQDVHFQHFSLQAPEELRFALVAEGIDEAV